jgi:cytochrome c oxidase cbb3-type subunit 3
VDEQHKVHVETPEDLTEEYQVHESPGYFRFFFWALVVWGVLYCAWFFVSGWDSEKAFQSKYEAVQSGQSE